MKRNQMGFEIKTSVHFSSSHSTYALDWIRRNHHLWAIFFRRIQCIRLVSDVIVSVFI